MAVFPAARADAASAIAQRVMALALALMLAACASLPSGVQRPVSHAITDVAATSLATVVQASLPAEAADRSAFRLLPDGDQALDARLALARRAEKTLDVQYYLIARDATGLQFLRELRDAAARGVRVRVLVDDLYATGADALLAGLAAQPNVEVRLFNPLPMRGGSFASRIVLSLHEFPRINRRMHNKLFIADNSFAVTGGRNVADEYFGRSEPANFIDMDILAAGPLVGELSAVFDRYWNSEHSYPVQALAGGDVEAADARRVFDARVRDVPVAEAPRAFDSLGQRDVSSQLASGQVQLMAAAARVLADAPGKIDAPQGAPADAPTVHSHTLDLIGTAQAEVLMASPYFVPGARNMAVMREAVARDVRVSVVTNSLATTDEPLAHFGYSRHRGDLLEMGVALYELMPTAEHKAAETTLDYHGSLGRLHAKLAVIDERWLYIGSMNMDRRSARWNTEIGLVVDSRAIARQVAGLLRRERLPDSYRLRLAEDTGRIEWVAQEGDEQVVHAREPAATFGRSLRLWMASRFVGEEML